MSVKIVDHTDDIIRELEFKKKRFVTEGGLIAESEMKARVPVDTGRLRGSIFSEVGSDGQEVYSDTGPSTDYAEKVEYGIGQRAQPYAEPGWQAALLRISSLAQELEL